MRITYNIETARVLLGLAYPEWDFPPYVIRDDGVYQSDEHREVSPPERIFDWSPAYDMNGPDAPDPMTAPMLPIPFTASELAAFMLDGTGSMIPEALECRIGDNAPNLESLGHPRKRKVREVLQEAFALVAQAVQRIGSPNYGELASAQDLIARYDGENGMANEREGVFEPGIGNEESRSRRDRAVASVQELKVLAEQADTVANQNWKEWRKRMVRALLGEKLSAKPETTSKPMPDQMPPVDVSDTRCKELASQHELSLSHWIELVGLGIGRHESYDIGRNGIAFRNWEEDFIAASPIEWQAEMERDIEIAPNLKFPCTPAELVEFVDTTAIGIHCFSVPEAFRQALAATITSEHNRSDSNTSVGAPEHKALDATEAEPGTLAASSRTPKPRIRRTNNKVLIKHCTDAGVLPHILDIWMHIRSNASKVGFPIATANDSSATGTDGKKYKKTSLERTLLEMRKNVQTT